MTCRQCSTRDGCEWKRSDRVCVAARVDEEGGKLGMVRQVVSRAGEARDGERRRVALGDGRVSCDDRHGERPCPGGCAGRRVDQVVE